MPDILEFDSSPTVDPSGDTTDYLTDIRRAAQSRASKVVTRPPLNAPQFSQEAEKERQFKAIQQSDRRMALEEPGPQQTDTSKTLTFDSGSTIDFDSSADKGVPPNVQPTASQVPSRRYTPIGQAFKEAQPPPLGEIPPMPTDPLAVPGYMITHGILEPAGHAIGKVLSPLAMLRNYTFGLSQGRPGEALTPPQLTESVFGQEGIEKHPYLTKGFEIAADMALPFPGVKLPKVGEMPRTGKAIEPEILSPGEVPPRLTTTVVNPTEMGVAQEPIKAKVTDILGPKPEVYPLATQDDVQGMYSGLRRQGPQAGPQSEPLPAIPGVPTYSQKNIGMVSRALDHTLDAMRKAGPYSSRMADLLQYRVNYAEQGTRQNYLDYLNLIRSIFPAKGKLASMEEALKSGDMDSLLNSNTHTLAGLTQRQIDAIVELHEVGGDISKASEAAQRTLPLTDPKVVEAYQKGWNILTGRASAHRSIQEQATVFDPITGEHYAVGQATPYWPHIPIDKQHQVQLTESFLKKVYQRNNYEESGIDYSTFKQRFTDWFHSTDPDIRFKKFAGIEYKRFFNALDEAKSHNVTVAEMYRRMGYETDPLRVLLRYNVGALNRAVSLAYKPEMTQLMDQVRLEYGSNNTTANFIQSAVERAEGISAREDMLQSLGWTTNLMSASYPSFLKFSWLSNIILQPNYLVMQTGLQNTIRSVFGVYAGKLGIPKDQIQQAVARSAADFPAFLARISRPENGWQQYTKTALELDMFALSDRATRSPLSGIAGYLHTENVARQFWKNPTDPKALGLLKEIGINPKELYDGMAKTNGVDIPEMFLARGAQVVANRSMGRTGIQGMPLWATSNDPASRMLLMLHRQMLSNEGALRRLLFNAPTMDVFFRRAVELVGLGTVTGMAYESLKNTLAGRDWYDPGKSFSETMKKLGIRREHEQKFAGYMIKSFLDSAGTFTTGIIMSGLGFASGQPGAATSVLTPPVASLVEDTAQKLAQGKPGEALMRASPLPIPPALYKKKPTQGDSLTMPMSGFGLEK